MDTRSMFPSINGTDDRQVDEYGRHCEGTRMLADGRTILRFRGGMLDGDVVDGDGRLVDVMPAVEGHGHMEYWRRNMLHRDDGLPAVISDGMGRYEWWENGVRVR